MTALLSVTTNNGYTKSFTTAKQYNSTELGDLVSNNGDSRIRGFTIINSAYCVRFSTEKVFNANTVYTPYCKSVPVLDSNKDKFRSFQIILKPQGFENTQSLYNSENFRNDSSIYKCNNTNTYIYILLIIIILFYISKKL